MVQRSPTSPWDIDDDDIWPRSQDAMKTTQMTTPVWDAKTIKEATEHCRNMGFRQGAIVAKRSMPGSGEDWKSTSRFHWGIVAAINLYIPGAILKDYKPLTIRWFFPTYNAGVAEQGCFPGELFIVHEAPDDGDLELSFARQAGAQC